MKPARKSSLFHLFPGGLLLLVAFVFWMLARSYCERHQVPAEVHFMVMLQMSGLLFLFFAIQCFWVSELKSVRDEVEALSDQVEELQKSKVSA